MGAMPCAPATSRSSTTPVAPFIFDKLVEVTGAKECGLDPEARVLRGSGAGFQ